MNSSSSYWENYYSKHREPADCSPFAEFITPFLKKGKRLIEFGCGNGRDSKHFAKQGINVLALDQCKKEIAFLSDKFKSTKNLIFLAEDMTNLPDLENSDFLYSRFTIHAIDRKGEEKLVKWAASNLKANGLFFVEVRSVKDELYGIGEALGDNAYFTDHYRRFIILEELHQQFTSNGLDIIYSIESKGLAPYKTQDPVVIRLIAQKK
ncbi:MAG: class I SAM-dependent methyltransferase [Saprospiraceae bacterium]|jgi:tellurite methyltransferase|nr:class I SAM-dependent methyltransferase [Saprospiraceae bacterium]MDG2419962.1 class I SAM-dependent methyltransferase [Saprospiraceae bacterium]